jgi:hypothetical protein
MTNPYKVDTADTVSTVVSDEVGVDEKAFFGRPRQNAQN